MARRKRNYNNQRNNNSSIQPVAPADLSIDKQADREPDIRNDFNPFSGFSISSRFAILNRLGLRDLNGNEPITVFAKYTKEDIATYLQDPHRYEKELRDAVIYIYGASPHFRRLIQYFTGLSDLAYVVSPYRIDPHTANKKSINRNYRRVLNTLAAMSIKTQFPKILTVCLREDVFYGTLWVTADNITIQQLPSDYCAVSSIEGNVLNASFDFSYFNTADNEKKLEENYPPEFQAKFNLYKQDRQKNRWQELDSPTSFAIKCNNDILKYAIPPFVGILREIYDIEDYKQLKLAKTALENYAMLVMKLGLDADGNFVMDYDKATSFFNNLSGVLPDEIGAVLSPLEINKIGFERNYSNDGGTITEAEQNLFTAAGVSSLLFNNEKASANALLLSIKADQAITYGIVKSLEDMVNRFTQSMSYGKNFKVTFLDVSQFNRGEAGDQYLKACQYGMPMVSYYLSSQGLGQSEMDSMNFLENDVLGIKDKFIPLRSSATQSGDGGAPAKDVKDLSDSGEQSREDGDDW